jgi:hypothetical protein
MCVMYTLMVEPLIEYCKKLDPNKIGPNTSPFLWTLYSTLASLHPKGRILQKLTRCVESEISNMIRQCSQFSWEAGRYKKKRSCQPMGSLLYSYRAV